MSNQRKTCDHCFPRPVDPLYTTFLWAFPDSTSVYSMFSRERTVFTDCLIMLVISLIVCSEFVNAISCVPGVGRRSTSQFIINSDFSVDVLLVETICPSTSDQSTVRHSFLKAHDETYDELRVHDYRTLEQLHIYTQEDSNWFNITVRFDSLESNEYKFTLEFQFRNSIREVSPYLYEFYWYDGGYEASTPQSAIMILPIGYDVVSVSDVAEWERRVQTERVVMKRRVVVSFTDVPASDGHMDWAVRFKMVQISTLTTTTGPAQNSILKSFRANYSSTDVLLVSLFTIAWFTLFLLALKRKRFSGTYH